MICDAEFGRKLRVFRELKNISREKFADLVNQKLYYTKASNNYFTAEKVYYFEMGKRQFTATFLMICCKILDINIQWFYEDLDKIISHNSSNLVSDSKNIMLLRLKFNNLIKILDKLSDKKISDKFLHLLETLEKEENKK